MKITKFGHCCLLIEEGEAKFLTDPGAFCDTPAVTALDAILITHEHPDHIHMPALAAVREANPSAEIITHSGVGKLLDAEKIPYRLIADGEELVVKGVAIASHGKDHACIHKDLPIVQNTGFLIDRRMYYPGDSFHAPGVPVEVLALPVAAPWLKIEEAIEYAKTVKPKIVFPVHDGMLRQDRLAFTRRIPTQLLEPLGIRMVDMVEGSREEF